VANCIYSLPSAYFFIFCLFLKITSSKVKLSYYVLWWSLSCLFMISTLYWGICSTFHSGHCTPEKRPSGAHWLGGWVGSKSSLDEDARRKISFAPSADNYCQ
jgi:hypothetical protein